MFGWLDHTVFIKTAVAVLRLRALPEHESSLETKDNETRSTTAYAAKHRSSNL